MSYAQKKCKKKKEQTRLMIEEGEYLDVFCTTSINMQAPTNVWGVLASGNHIIKAVCQVEDLEYPVI